MKLKRLKEILQLIEDGYEVNLEEYELRIAIPQEDGTSIAITLEDVGFGGSDKTLTFYGPEA